MYKNCNPTEYRQELKQKILETASREFRNKGIKAVKMDDIANILSVSKRTVYEIYENKEQLLMESIKADTYAFDQHLAEFAARKDISVMDVILEFFRVQMRNLTGVNPNFYIELERYDSITQWLNENHQKKNQTTQAFFAQGIKEGYFRDDINYELILQVADGAIGYIRKAQLYKLYTLKEIFSDVIMLFVRGLCTMKGISELDCLIEEIKNK